MTVRAYWLIAVVAIIALGILSRTIALGHPIWDKYLGDVLYAAMVYALIRLFTRASVASVLLISLAIMVAIESFQITEIPAGMFHSPHVAIRICARLLGVQFNFYDLFAYAVGCAITFAVDRSLRSRGQQRVIKNSN